MDCTEPTEFLCVAQSFHLDLPILSRHRSGLFARRVGPPGGVEVLPLHSVTTFEADRTGLSR